MKRCLVIVISCLVVTCFCACAQTSSATSQGASKAASASSASASATSSGESARSASASAEAAAATSGSVQPASADETASATLVMSIDGQQVQVAWEDNASVEALKGLVAQGPLTIQMSKYGGFEQVGSLGADVPRDDVQTTTAAGDIVLYNGNSLVVFYGSNSWAYTRLGTIVDASPAEMESILGGEDVEIVLSLAD